MVWISSIESRFPSSPNKSPILFNPLLDQFCIFPSITMNESCLYVSHLSSRGVGLNEVIFMKLLCLLFYKVVI